MEEQELNKKTLELRKKFKNCKTVNTESGEVCYRLCDIKEVVEEMMSVVEEEIKNRQEPLTEDKGVNGLLANMIADLKKGDKGYMLYPKDGQYSMIEIPVYRMMQYLKMEYDVLEAENEG